MKPPASALPPWLAALRDEPGVFPPLAIKVDDARNPATVRCEWEGRSWTFLAVPLKLVTPKRLVAALSAAGQGTDRRLPPMILAEHLKERDVDRIAEAGASGIDLCGNGIVRVPGEVLVRQVGQPRPDRGSRTGARPAIRNVYRGTSGLVARAFLLTPRFDTNAAVRAEVAARGGDVSPATVSKVLGTLEEDLIVSRDNGGKGGGGRLIDAEELARRLRENFRPPAVARTGAFCYRPGRGGAALVAAAERAKVAITLDGRSSASAYATRAATDAPRLYCTDLRRLEKAAADVLEPVDRYADFVIDQTEDPAAMYDAREQDDGPPLASPMQVWLELAAGDAREREAAGQVLQRLLADLEEARR